MPQKLLGVNRGHMAKRSARVTSLSPCVKATLQAALGSLAKLREPLATAQAKLKAAQPNSQEALALAAQVKGLAAQVKGFTVEAKNATTNCEIAAKNSVLYMNTSGNDSGDYAPCYPAKCVYCREHDPTRNSGVARSCLSGNFDYMCCYDINNNRVSCAGLGGYSP